MEKKHQKFDMHLSPNLDYYSIFSQYLIYCWEILTSLKITQLLKNKNIVQIYWRIFCLLIENWDVHMIKKINYLEQNWYFICATIFVNTKHIIKQCNNTICLKILQLNQLCNSKTKISTNKSHYLKLEHKKHHMFIILRTYIYEEKTLPRTAARP